MTSRTRSDADSVWRRSTQGITPSYFVEYERWRPYRSLAVSYLFASEFEDAR